MDGRIDPQSQTVVDEDPAGGVARARVAFIVLFWAVRGIKAIKFLATYKVKVAELPRVAPADSPR
jgi:hypothetical protein